jgi:hypothetical protein
LITSSKLYKEILQSKRIIKYFYFFYKTLFSVLDLTHLKLFIDFLKCNLALG